MEDLGSWVRLGPGMGRRAACRSTDRTVMWLRHTLSHESLGPRLIAMIRPSARAPRPLRSPRMKTFRATRASPPSGPETRRRANPGVRPSFATVRDRAGPDPGPGSRRRIGWRADCQRPSFIIVGRGPRVLRIRRPGSGCRASGGRGHPGTYRSRIREAHPRPAPAGPAGAGPTHRVAGGGPSPTGGR